MSPASLVAFFMTSPRTENLPTSAWPPRETITTSSGHFNSLSGSQISPLFP